MLQKDYELIHRNEICTEWIQHNIAIPIWPASMSDANPIENFYLHMNMKHKGQPM